MDNNIIEIKGKYDTAKVFADIVEESSMSQIYDILNHPISKEANTRIMPDVHAGAGCVIGYTAKLRDKVIPNLIGVDIGCGVLAFRLTCQDINFEKLDEFIREHIPSGRGINESPDTFEIRDDLWTVLESEYNVGFENFMEAENGLFWFVREIDSICKKSGQNLNYVLKSLGSLGGGNHFCEVGKDDYGKLWLSIHSGSRNFGFKVANYHQKIAKQNTRFMSDEEYKTKVNEIKEKYSGKEIGRRIALLRKAKDLSGVKKDLEYLEGSYFKDYMKDMKIAQLYAKVNREMMASRILRGLHFDTDDKLESVHNYIDKGIVRKGAISAYKGEKVIIPLNMAEGNIIGEGKGNADWNYSAPHGAGRVMSRRKAKENINIKDYKKRMKGVWTSSVNENTLDEAPQAYKDANSIIKYLEDTVDIKTRVMPVYNFKAND